METKSIEEKRVIDENADEGADQEVEKKIGLKKQKSDNANDEDEDMQWKKIESIVSAAKEIYQSGKSSFHDVVESMAATFQDLLANEGNGAGLGGLYGGPQMDLPAEPEPNSKEEAQ